MNIAVTSQPTTKLDVTTGLQSASHLWGCVCELPWRMGKGSLLHLFAFSTARGTGYSKPGDGWFDQPPCTCNACDILNVTLQLEEVCVLMPLTLVKRVIVVK